MGINWIPILLLAVYFIAIVLLAIFVKPWLGLTGAVLFIAYAVYAAEKNRKSP